MPSGKHKPYEKNFFNARTKYNDSNWWIQPNDLEIKEEAKNAKAISKKKKRKK